MERQFLKLFEFDIDFTTHFDFYQTYMDKIEKQLKHNLGAVDGESEESISSSLYLLQQISQMSLILIKMALQCKDFSKYSSLVFCATPKRRATPRSSTDEILSNWPIRAGWSEPGWRVCWPMWPGDA